MAGKNTAVFGIYRNQAGVERGERPAGLDSYLYEPAA